MSDVALRKPSYLGAVCFCRDVELSSIETIQCCHHSRLQQLLSKLQSEVGCASGSDRLFCQLDEKVTGSNTTSK
eukprot:1349092-Amphidinium_carterae.1